MGFLKLLKVNGGFQDTVNVGRNHVIALMFLRFCIHGNTTTTNIARIIIGNKCFIVTPVARITAGHTSTGITPRANRYLFYFLVTNRTNISHGLLCIHGGRLLLGPVDTGSAAPEQPCDRASGGSTVGHLLLGTVVLTMTVESRHASNIVTGNLAGGNLSGTGNSGVDPLRLCLGRGKTSSSVFLAKCQPALGVGDSGSRGFV